MFSHVGRKKCTKIHDNHTRCCIFGHIIPNISRLLWNERSNFKCWSSNDGINMFKSLFQRRPINSKWLLIKICFRTCAQNVKKHVFNDFIRSYQLPSTAYWVLSLNKSYFGEQWCKDGNSIVNGSPASNQGREPLSSIVFPEVVQGSTVIRYYPQTMNYWSCL